VNPLIGFTLAHPKQPPLHHLERIGFEVDEDEKQPIFRRRQGAVLRDSKLAGGPRFPIETHTAMCAWNAASKGGTNV
jgi:hypothetical protein